MLFEGCNFQFKKESNVYDTNKSSHIAYDQTVNAGVCLNFNFQYSFRRVITGWCICLVKYEHFSKIAEQNVIIA